MVSVAQKTLLFTITTIFYALTAQAQQVNNKYYNTEKLIYNVELNGISVGDATISYTPNKQDKTYKFFAKAETEGFIKNIYNINDSINVYGFIKQNSFEPINHTVKIKENSKKSHRTAFFDYKNSLIRVQNNKEKKSEDLLLLNNAKDIFSTLYELRFNTDINKINANKDTFYRTIQFAHKTVVNKITVSNPYNLTFDKKNEVKVRDVLIESKKVRMHNISKEQIAAIKSGENKPEDFSENLVKKDNYKFKQNIKVVISSDNKKIPLIIKYNTKFGTFKATLKKYEKQ